MYSPTHVQVTVYKARNLLIKGKSGTNDTYVTIKLGDEKYQTSIKERSVAPEWMEECDLPLVEMTDVIHLNVYHRNLLGIDEFLGHADIGLDQFKIYDRPSPKWYSLSNKPGSKKANKYRGEIQIRVTFIVQSNAGSNSSLNKRDCKRSSSIKTLAHSVGEKLTTGKWHSKGSLSNRSGSRPDLSSALSDSGDQSPTVRKLDKRDLTRSHTILPTSYNNQLLQEAPPVDDVDSTGTSEDAQNADLERWNSPLAPFRRKKKTRLSKMNILSQSSLTLDNEKTPPSGDLDPDGEMKGLEPLLHKPHMAKSMFDLTTTTIDEFSREKPKVNRSDSIHEVENKTESGKLKSVSQQASCSETMDSSQVFEDSDFSTQSVDGNVFEERAIDVSFDENHGSIARTKSLETRRMTPDRRQNSNGTAVPRGPPSLPDVPRNMDTMATGAVRSVPSNKGPFGSQSEEIPDHKLGDKTPDSVAEQDPQSSDDHDSRTSETKITENNEVMTEVPSIQDTANPDEFYPAEKNPFSDPADSAAHDETSDNHHGNSSPTVKDEVKATPVIIEPEQLPSDQQDLAAKDKSFTSVSSSGSESDDEGVSTESSPDSKRQSGSKFTEVVTPDPEVIDKSPAKEVDKQSDRVDKYKRMKDVNRRHTLRHTVARATTHDLHQGILEYKRAQEERDRPLPTEVMDQFNEHSREDLVRLILEQRQLLHKKDTYNRDLEDYIDNLLVKVMEATPKLLAHPSSRPSPPKSHRTNGFPETSPAIQNGSHRTSPGKRQPSTILHVSNHHQRPGTAPPASANQRQAARNNVVNSNNSNNFGLISQASQRSNKKPFNNPFKKIQQALK